MIVLCFEIWSSLCDFSFPLAHYSDLQGSERPCIRWFIWYNWMSNQDGSLHILLYQFLSFNHVWLIQPINGGMCTIIVKLPWYIEVHTFLLNWAEHEDYVVYLNDKSIHACSLINWTAFKLITIACVVN